MRQLGEDSALVACATCAVALGADPMVAPVVAGLVALAVRYALPALTRELVERVRRPSAPRPPTAE